MPETIAIRYGGSLIAPPERTIQRHLEEYLVCCGVRCFYGGSDIGKPDLGSDRAIYEVKRVLTTNNILHAIGQLKVYEHFDTDGRTPVIVGLRTKQTAALEPVLCSMGIRLVTWMPGGERVFSETIDAIERIDTAASKEVSDALIARMLRRR